MHLFIDVALTSLYLIFYDCRLRFLLLAFWFGGELSRSYAYLSRIARDLSRIRGELTYTCSRLLFTCCHWTFTYVQDRNTCE